MSYAQRKLVDILGLFLFLAIMVYAIAMSAHEIAFGALCAVVAFAVSWLANHKMENREPIEFAAYRLACMILAVMALLSLVYGFISVISA